MSYGVEFSTSNGTIIDTNMPAGFVFSHETTNYTTPTTVLGAGSLSYINGPHYYDTLVPKTEPAPLVFVPCNVGDDFGTYGCFVHPAADNWLLQIYDTFMHPEPNTSDIWVASPMPTSILVFRQITPAFLLTRVSTYGIEAYSSSGTVLFSSDYPPLVIKGTLDITTGVHGSVAALPSGCLGVSNLYISANTTYLLYDNLKGLYWDIKAMYIRGSATEMQSFSGLRSGFGGGGGLHLNALFIDGSYYV